MLWVLTSLEAPSWDTSNESHNVCYREEIVKYQYLLVEKSPLSRAIDWLPSNWYMNQHKNYFKFTKILSFGMSFSLIWRIIYEFLTGKGDNMCRKIFKEEYFTFVI